MAATRGRGGRRRPRSRARAGGGWLAHVLLSFAYYLVVAALVFGGGALAWWGFAGLWGGGALAGAIGGVLLVLLGIAAFIVLPGRIKRITGREVSGEGGTYAPGG